MIKFYTSYYANIKNIPKKCMIVPISLVIPEFIREMSDVTIVKDNFIAPDGELLSDIKEGRIGEEEYKTRYVKKICDYINGCARFKDLKDWAEAINQYYGTEYDSICFVCYERPDEFCHRQIFSKMLNMYGVHCEELGYKNTENKQKNALW